MSIEFKHAGITYKLVNAQGAAQAFAQPKVLEPHQATQVIGALDHNKILWSEIRLQFKVNDAEALRQRLTGKSLLVVADDSVLASYKKPAAAAPSSSTAPAPLQSQPVAEPPKNNTPPDTHSDSVTADQSTADPCEGEPISVVSGEELLALEDFALPGPVPLVWRRTYRSGRSDHDAGLGHGWSHAGGETLVLNETTVDFTDAEGRRIRFERPYLGQTSRQRFEGLSLTFLSVEHFVLRQAGQPDKLFERAGGNHYRLSQLRHRAYRPPEKDAAGHWSGEQGYALTFHYNAQGRLVRIQGNWQRGLLIRRTDHGRISAIHQLDAQGEALEPALAEYDYSAEGDLIAQRNAEGAGEQYQYDNHVIRQRTLASGFRFHFEWDQLSPHARCLRQWGERGIYDYRFEWDPVQRISRATDSRGHSALYHYNAQGRVTQHIDKEGHATRYEHNSAGKVTAQIDPLGHKTQYHYDSEQRLLGLTDALGQQRGGSYFQEQLTTYTDALGQRWQRRFDRRGLLTEVSGPRGDTTRYSHNANGLLSEVIDPAERRSRYRWNTRAELIEAHDPLGNTLHYRYDAWGRLSSVSAQAQGQTREEAQQQATTAYAYSPSGRLSTVTYPDGTRAGFAYNPSGQLTRYTDPQGRITEYRYDDGLSQPSQRTDPAGHTLKYEYDKERNLTALINENGDKYEFYYDANERLIKEVGFDGRTQHYKYNDAGHLIKHLDSGVIQTEFERDALGQLHSRRSQPLQLNAHPPEQSKYRYDALGRLIETYNEHQYLQFEYDALGNITREQHYDLNDKKQRVSASQQTILHQYNILGQRVSTQLPDGTHIHFGYHDSLGFKHIRLNGELITQVARDSLGREIERQQGPLNTHSGYDPQGRLQTQHTVHQEHKHRLIQRDYGYDSFGNLNWLKDGSDEVNYVYDTLNRLKRTEGTHPECFDFDPAGNLLALGEGTSLAPGLAKGNRLLIQGDKHFEYDARGNLIQETKGKDGKLKKTFHYNLQNQLIKVETHTKHETVTYQYDPLGRRIEKRDAFGATTYLWTDNLLAQETRNNLKKTYVYEPGSFRPAALVQDNQVYHYHLDHLGTPRELTNEQGEIVWKAKYKTYGNVALKEVEEIENNLRFQGQYFDEETGLHYNRFRYYSPDTGQFINQDPIGLLGGINNYQYAPNPTGWIDPLGLCKEQQNTIPDDYDLVEDLAVLGTVNKAAGPGFVETSERLYQSIPGMQDTLHAHEFLALRTYTSNFYQEMNDLLRGVEPDLGPTWGPVNSAATKALEKLGKSPGRTHQGTSYRGTVMTEEKIHKRFPEVGATYSDKGFMSSSTNPKGAFNGNVQMNIQGKSGVKIADISALPKEEEALFKPETEFKITKKEKSPDGTWHIDLEEL